MCESKRIVIGRASEQLSEVERSVAIGSCASLAGFSQAGAPGLVLGSDLPAAAGAYVGNTGAHGLDSERATSISAGGKAVRARVRSQIRRGSGAIRGGESPVGELGGDPMSCPLAT